MIFFHWNWNDGILGALCLLLAEHQNRQAKQAKQKTVNPGLPILDEKKPKDALQLFGRIFLVLLFCTLMHFSKGVSPPNKVRIILKRSDTITCFFRMKCQMPLISFWDSKKKLCQMQSV